MAENIAALLLGFCIDLIIGDPSCLWHPICGIGWLIRKLEIFLRRVMESPPHPGSAESMVSEHGKNKERSEQLAGIGLVCLVCMVTGLAAAGILFTAGVIHPLFRFCIKIVMSWQILALKSLKTESMKVYDALIKGDTEAARTAVSMIVGRDTRQLDDVQITKAAIETVAENTSDGVVAPFLCLLIGGPVAGFLYKAVNTMDSMVGYRGDRYEYFGKAAARLDDLVNMIPARVSAVFMIMAAWVLRYDAKGAVRIFLRDRFQHKSPNSAQTEAVCAGALQIQLAGDASYFGILVKKPWIGDDVRQAEYEDIRRANRLLYGTALLLAGMTAGGFLCYLISTGAIYTVIK